MTFVKYFHRLEKSIFILALCSTSVLGQTFTVDSNGDQPWDTVLDGVCDNGSGNCTLRAAIDEANALGGGYTIEFSGAFVINIDSELAVTTNSNIINGDIGNNGDPNIVITTGVNTNGFHITGSSNTIQGFNFILFTSASLNAPIVIDGGGANTVITNYIGTNLAGDNVAGTGNFRSLRIVNGATGNFIGNATVAGRNIISGNTFGMEINASNNNQIRGNIIGLDVSGTLDFGNGNIGLEVINSSGTIIGSATDGRNIISGNSQQGVYLDASTNSTIFNNYIGTNQNGDAAIPNGAGRSGIHLDNGANNNDIGDGSPGGRNVISGNGSQGGVFIEGSTGNTIIGNYIGVGADGSADLGNGRGVALGIGSTGNFVGNGIAGGGNVIAGNGGGHEILISAGPNTILGNHIGVNAVGDAVVNLVPAGIGIQIVTVADGNTIGNGTIDGRNVISGNTVGISIASDNNTIEGNIIGLDLAGTGDLGNAGAGIAISSGDGNTIGGIGADDYNVISGNSGIGISVSNAIGTQILGNRIGTNLAGSGAIGNDSDGISILGGSTGTIVGTSAAGNVISGNGLNGIQINSSNTSSIQGNLIGLTLNGLFALGNASDGILITNTSTTNTIGGNRGAGEGNSISSNGLRGITVNAPGNFIYGNVIGLSTSGIFSRGNTDTGIEVTADNNFIGNITPGFGNVISDNSYGIDVSSGSNTTILANIIGMNNAGTGPKGNANEGIRIRGTSTGVTIGNGTLAGANYISDNGSGGILIRDAGVVGVGIDKNYIGVEIDGFSPMGNTGNGVTLDVNSSFTSIGNTIIANNANHGIDIQGGSSSNVFTENSIYNNTNKGINDPGAPANSLSVTNLATDGTISGTADITATFVDIFFDAEDEGESFLATVPAVGGVWSYSANLLTAFPPGLYFITATQLNLGFTSEFSTAFDIIPVFDPYVVTNTNDDGVGSMRWVIENANATLGVQTVLFDIPIGGPGYVFSGGEDRWTIQLAADLPQITDAVILDAKSQTNGVGNFKIALDGQGALTNGFDFQTGGSEVYGFYISGFTNGIDLFYSGGGGSIIGAPGAGNTLVSNSGAGVTASLADGHTIQGNFVGTDENGSLGLGNNRGLTFPSNSGANLVGGINPGEENVVSGNSISGISFNSGGINVITNNLIGTDPTGLLPIPNGVGLSFGSTSSTNTIQDNVISSNTNAGIQFNASSNNIVQGNSIGVGSDGVTAMGNGIGIEAFGGTNFDNNIIGGVNAGEANIIAYNTGAGILIPNANHDFNQIIANEIFCNIGKGIDLNGVGNDAKLAPVISSIIEDAVTGTGVDGDVIHVYRDNTGCGPLQGREYLGFAIVGGGLWTYNNGAIDLGDFLNATATDASNNTSEFAINFGEIDLYQGVDNSGTPVTDGQVGDVDIGSAFEGYDLDQIFAIENTSLAPLTITSITVTGSDYEILGAPAIVGSGATENFILRLSGATPGTFTTTVTIVNDDENEGTFDFPVTGDINVNIVDPLLVTNVDNGLITGSFRTVVAYTNTLPGPDVISFDPVLVGQEILLVDDIFLTEAVTIDGDFDGSGDCVPDITINGLGGGDGLWIDGGNTLIQHLNIINYPNAAIWVRSDNNQISGNYIGINLAGDDASLTGNLYGIWVLDGDGNVVGGSTLCEQNVISGNFWGVVVGGNATTNFNTQVIGNIIGLDATGTFVPVQGNTDGVVLDETGLGGLHTIGGINPGEGNIISGNGRGILVADVNGEIQILGNYIGTDITGTLPIGNTSYGIYTLTNTRVGNGTAAGRNIISGHPFPSYGLYFAQSSSYTGDSYALGNYFGTDASGTLPIPNYVGLGAGNQEVAQSVFIGDGTPGGRNLFAYNDYGIDIVRGNTYVSGNLIGTDPTGTVTQGNMVGISVWSQTEPSLIGDGTPAGANVISGNTTGIDIGFGPTDNVTIDLNYIGVIEDGVTPMANTGDGIYMHNNVTDVSINSNIIGNNSGNGIHMDGAGVINNLITTNSIFNNTLKGIYIINGAQNSVVPPVFTTITATTISGTSDAGADIQVFADAVDEGEYFIGSAIADGAGDWSLAYVPASIPAGLVNATAIQTSASNSSEFSLAALFDNALDFDGTDDFVSISDDPTLQFGAGDFTVEAWFYFDGTPTIAGIIAKRNPLTPFQQITIAINDGVFNGGPGKKLFIEALPDGRTFTGLNPGPNDRFIVSPDDLSPGWHHVALVQDYDTQLILYLDGVNVGASSTSHGGLTFDIAGQPLTIGNFNGGGFFDGIVDEARIWNDVRTEIEIQASLNTILLGTEPGLVAYYQFNEGVPGGNNVGITTLPDQTTNANDGTLNTFSLSGPSSNWVSSGAFTGLPGTPGDLFTTEISSSQIDLSWADYSFNETGFIIERSDGNNTSFVQINTVGTDVTTYSDNTVTGGNGYFYRVIATNGAGDSNPSNEKFGSTIAPSGNALNFDGTNDLLTVPYAFSLGGSPTQSFTWSAWIKMPANISGGSGLFRFFISTVEPSLDFPRVDMAIEKATGLLAAVIQSPGGVTSQNITGMTDLRDDQWHQVTFVRDRSLDELRIYVDGNLDTTPLTDDDVDGTNVGDLYIGDWGRTPQNGRTFLGEIDEVRIWNDVRTEAEIQGNLYNTLVGNEANLVAYYRFDQGIPGGDNTTPPIDLLPDRSANNNNGTLSNFTLNGASSNWVVSTYTGGIIASDYNSLVALYNATDGANWIDNTNWLTAAPVSTWYGVTVAGDRVGNVILPGNNLNGFIPSEIGDLTDIDVLDLSNNIIGGSMPAELGNLTKLIHLILENNQLTGSIPAGLNNLSLLQWLILSNNQLSGSIPPELGALSSLNFMALVNNQLTGTIPVELGNLSNLTRLDLANNQLTGSIPVEIGDLLLLELLSFYQNNLSGVIPSDLGDLVQLSLLSFGENQFDGNIPTELGNLIQLNLLDFSNNQFVGGIPVELGQLTQLTELYFWDNLLTGPIPDQLGNLTSLTATDFGLNQFTGPVPATFTNLINLTYFGIEGNLLTTLPDFSTIASLTDLEVLDNQLEFDDLEPNIVIPTFIYSPQAQIPGPGPQIIVEGTTLNLIINVGGSANQYQWVKDGSDIIGESTNNLLIASVTSGDAGTYYLRITNTLLPGLTLRSDDIVVTVTGAPEPEINVYFGPDNTGTLLSDGQLTDVDFGADVLGNDITQNFAIENIGSAVLNISGITVTGTDFSVLSIPPTVAVGATETFTVQLSGANIGTFNDVLTIQNDDTDEATFDFPVTGTINPNLEPEINLYVGPDNTGTVIADGQATAINMGVDFLGNDILQVFAIENTGSSDLNISSVSVGPGPFSITTTAPPVITPGSTGTFTVQLSGVTIGTFNTTVTILNDDLDEATFDFNVSGSINLPPEAEIDVFAGPDNTGLSILDGQVTSFSVGSAPVGTDIDQVFTIENTGSTDLNILGITSSSTAFSLQSPLPPPIPVGAVDNFTIRLSGAAEGTFSASITIENNDPDEAFFDFPISGTITGPEIEVFVGMDNSGVLISAGQVTAIDFGAETAGTDIDQVFAIENQGASDLIISGISVTGPDFSILTGASQTISAGLTGNFTVRLNGQIAGSYTDNIVITSNDSDEATFGFPVAGTINAIEIVIKNGQDASAPIVINGQPDSVDLGQTQQFQDILKVFIIENTGTTDLNIISIVTDQPSIFTVIDFPARITPGTFDTFTVRLNALVPGIYGANVIVNSDAGAYTFPIIGEVIPLGEDPPIIVYNALTPNGDGKHDFLKIENIEAYPGNKVFIYTKLGKKVFEIDNYNNADSQRRFEGYSNVGNVESSADGTYYYVIIRENVKENTSGFFILTQ